MNCTHLGCTGLQASRLCLGTMNLGWTAGVYGEPQIWPDPGGEAP